MKKLKIKTEMLRRNGASHKAVESVLRPEGSLWWERFVKKVDALHSPVANPGLHFGVSI